MNRYLMLGLAWIAFVAIIGPTLISARDTLAVSAGFLGLVLLIGATFYMLAPVVRAKLNKGNK